MSVRKSPEDRRPQSHSLRGQMSVMHVGDRFYIEATDYVAMQRRVGSVWQREGAHESVAGRAFTVSAWTAIGAKPGVCRVLVCIERTK